MRTLTPKLTEDQLVASIAAALGEQPRKLRVGIGDDAAVWKTPRSHSNLVTTDMLVDGVHFRLESTSAQALGHKALAVNLSDIAAMGGQPKVAVVALGVTPVIDEAWVRLFYNGMADLARAYSCTVAGGDIVKAPALTICVTVAGDIRQSNVRLRSGAKPGDFICVSGPLGLAAAGLQSSEPTLRRAYETPAPRVREGQMLASSRLTHAMMDISDGLSLDVARMARASRVDAVLDVSALHVHPALEAFAHSHELSATDLMLHGGDDYELLVAVDPRGYQHLANRFRSRFKRELTRCGKFEAGTGKVWLLENGKKIEHQPSGYDHLST